MPVNVVQWRVEIDVFDVLCDVRYTTKFSLSSRLLSVLISTLLLLLLSGDIDLNQGLIKLIPFFSCVGTLFAQQ